MATAPRSAAVVGAFAAVAASFLGPIAPLVVLGAEYFYDRRDLLFTPTGTPVQAIAADRSVLPLSALHDRTAARHATLSINTRLTDSARRMGLRNGDPVGVLLTGSGLARTGSGLVVPTRVGEQVGIAAPNGDYAVTASAAHRNPCSPSQPRTM